MRRSVATTARIAADVTRTASGVTAMPQEVRTRRPKPARRAAGFVGLRIGEMTLDHPQQDEEGHDKSHFEDRPQLRKLLKQRNHLSPIQYTSSGSRRKMPRSWLTRGYASLSSSTKSPHLLAGHRVATYISAEHCRIPSGSYGDVVGTEPAPVDDAGRVMIQGADLGPGRFARKRGL